MIGLSSSSKNMAEFVEPPFLIDKYSCSYIVNNKILKTNQNISNTAGIQIHRNLKDDPVYLAFEYLVKEKKLFLVDGHKFGCSFLAYKEHPDSAHAVHLVFVNPENS
jgi:tRNA splicing endonuclease